MKSSPRRSRYSPLSLEPLEPRWAMAGAVVVNVSGNNIKITGDDAENDIALVGNINTNVLSITGNNTAVTINGTLPAANAVGKLEIDFKKANIAIIEPRGALGVDRVLIDNLSMGNKLSIKGKNGCDVRIDDTFARQTVIDFDAGNGVREIVNNIPLGCLVDIVDCVLGNKGGPSSPFKGGVAIYTKDFRDKVEVGDSILEGTVIVKTKGEIDVIGFFDVAVHSTFGEQKKLFTVDSGKGDDVVAGNGINVNGKTKIVTSDGADKLFFGGGSTFVGAVSVDTGKGDDIIGVGKFADVGSVGTVFQNKITVKTGSENDKLMIGFQVEFPQLKHSIDGGKQTAADVLEVQAPLDPNDESVFKNWETRGGFIQQNLFAFQTEVFGSFA